MVLNAAQIDYLTLTTYEDDIVQLFHEWMKQEHETAERIDGRELKQRLSSNRRGYRGPTFSLESMGDCFIGIGVQEEREHYMMQVSGQWAGHAFTEFRTLLKDDNLLRCTRIDVQITVLEPIDWDQFRFLADMKDVGRATGWKESLGDTGFLATVYVGSRESDRFIRLYEKEAERVRYLRYEVEFKSDRAQAIAHRYARGTLCLSGVMRYEIERMRHQNLNDLYLEHLANFDPMRIKVVKDVTTEKTERWILKQVIPALRRYANAHSSRSSVLGEVIDACREKERHA